MMVCLFSALVFLVLAYTFGREPFCRLVDRHLAKAQYEHARWIAICLEFTREGCDPEAKIAAEQVAVLREEINFYRRLLVRLQRRSTV